MPPVVLEVESVPFPTNNEPEILTSSPNVLPTLPFLYVRPVPPCTTKFYLILESPKVTDDSLIVIVLLQLKLHYHLIFVRMSQLLNLNQN